MSQIQGHAPALRSQGCASLRGADERLLGLHIDQSVPVAFRRHGMGGEAGPSHGFGSAPVRWFRHMLPAYGHTLETCEFRTSITCSACLRPTQHARLPASISELEELPVGQRRVLNKNVQVQAQPHQHPMSCRPAVLHAAHTPHACMHGAHSSLVLICPQALTVHRTLPDNGV